MRTIFAKCFSSLEDTRYKNKQYKLIDIIVIVVFGTLAGMKNFIEIEIDRDVYN